MVKLDVTCARCGAPLHYSPRGDIKRKLCPCGYKGIPVVSSTASPAGVQTVQTVQTVQNTIAPCNASHGGEEIALQDVQNGQNGQPFIASVQVGQPAASPSSASPSQTSGSSSPPVSNCNASKCPSAIARRGAVTKKLGSPLLDLDLDDAKILGGIDRQESQVTIARGVGWSPSRTCRRIQRYEASQLVITDSKTRQRVLNPVYFPKQAGKQAPPVATPAGTLPGGKYNYNIHNLMCYCEPLPSSKADFDAFPNTFKLMNPMTHWDKHYIEDKDLGWFGSKRFGNPDFRVQATSKQFIFYPWGWSNVDDAAAIADAQKGAEELHDLLERQYKLKLGFRFEITGPGRKGKPRQPHFAMNAIDPATATPPQGSTPAPQPAPSIDINGVPLRQDPTPIPGGLEGTGLVAGRTLAQVGKDLESIPKLVQDHVNSALQQLVADAVARAMAQVIPQIGQAVAQSMTQVVPQIGQAVAQAMQAAMPAMADAMKNAIQQAFTQSQSQKPQAPPPGGQYT